MEEEKFLIDSNIIIYFLDSKIPEGQREKVRRIFKQSFIISTISNIEVLGWKKLTGEDKSKTEKFLNNATVLYIDKTVEQKSIELKTKYNIDTPDAIIAATAICFHCTLVTRNENDFKDILNLKIFNPFS